MPTAANSKEIKEPKKEVDAGERSLDELLDEIDTLETVCEPNGQSGDAPKFSSSAMDQLDFLDTLDSFPSSLPVSVGGASVDTLSDFSSNGDYN